MVNNIYLIVTSLCSNYGIGYINVKKSVGGNNQKMYLKCSLFQSTIYCNQTSCKLLECGYKQEAQGL